MPSSIVMQNILLHVTRVPLLLEVVVVVVKGKEEGWKGNGS
jgi:hypothetical protein